MECDLGKLCDLYVIFLVSGGYKKKGEGFTCSLFESLASSGCTALTSCSIGESFSLLLRVNVTYAVGGNVWIGNSSFAQSPCVCIRVDSFSSLAAILYYFKIWSSSEQFPTEAVCMKIQKNPNWLIYANPCTKYIIYLFIFKNDMLACPLLYPYITT